MKYFNALKGDKKYPQLLIETIGDLKLFMFHDSLIRSKQAVSFWMGFKSQKYRVSPTDYYAHERECKNTAIQNVLANTLVFRNSATSLIDYCNTTDKILGGKYESMLNHLKNGMVIRTNHLGGFSPYEDGMFVIDNMIDVSIDEQVKNFIMTGELDLSMEITKKCIIIENSDSHPKSLIDRIKQKTSLNFEDIQIFNTFKLKTILWKETDYINFFKNGLSQGLNTIAFESSFQDMTQFNKLKTLLETLISKTNSKLTVYIVIF